MPSKLKRLARPCRAGKARRRACTRGDRRGLVGEGVEVTLLERAQTILILVVTVPSSGRVTVVRSAVRCTFNHT